MLIYLRLWIAIQAVSTPAASALRKSEFNSEDHIEVEHRLTFATVVATRKTVKLSNFEVTVS